MIGWFKISKFHLITKIVPKRISITHQNKWRKLVYIQNHPNCKEKTLTSANSQFRDNNGICRCSKTTIFHRPAKFADAAAISHFHANKGKRFEFHETAKAKGWCFSVCKFPSLRLSRPRETKDLTFAKFQRGRVSLDFHRIVQLEVIGQCASVPSLVGWSGMAAIFTYFWCAFYLGCQICIVLSSIRVNRQNKVWGYLCNQVLRHTSSFNLSE